MNESRVIFPLDLCGTFRGKCRQFITVISGVSFTENDVIVSVIDVASMSIFTCEQLQLFAVPRDIQIVSQFSLPSLYTYNRQLISDVGLLLTFTICDCMKIFSSIFFTE